MKLFTYSTYANQTVILPFVGEVALDQDASFECTENAEELIEATKGSLDFSQSTPVKKPKRNVSEKESLPTASIEDQFRKLIDELGIEKAKEILELYKPVDTSAPIKEQIETRLSQLTEDEKKKLEKDLNNEPLDVEVMIAAIEQAQLDELKQLASMIPKVSKKAIKDLSEQDLKKFLIAKVKDAEQSK